MVLKSQKCRVKMGNSRLINSDKLEYGPGKSYDAFPSSQGFGVRRQSYSSFLASSALKGSGLAADARLPDGHFVMPPYEPSRQRSWPSPRQPQTLAADARLPDGHF